jgi:hypothetical protein
MKIFGVEAKADGADGSAFKNRRAEQRISRQTIGKSQGYWGLLTKTKGQMRGGKESSWPCEVRRQTRLPFD